MGVSVPNKRLGFLLVPGFALMSCSAAVEPLRAANLLAGRGLYDVRFLSMAGGPVAASAGARFDTQALREAGEDFDLIFVVAGGNPVLREDPALWRGIQRLAAQGIPLGGISGGGVDLAKAGVMGQRRFTVHWEHYEAMGELGDWPLMERRLFVIDRDRYTCAGGAAALDMMHAMIAADHGTGLARQVSEWFIHTGVRVADAPQRMGAAARYDIHNPALLAAVELMESHIADPLSQEQLADLSGIGKRQIQRLFTERFGMPMMVFYRRIRLETADKLLQQSVLPVLEIALATGFANPAHFSRAYRDQFGISPSQRRRDGAG